MVTRSNYRLMPKTTYTDVYDLCIFLLFFYLHPLLTTNLTGSAKSVTFTKNPCAMHNSNSKDLLTSRLIASAELKQTIARDQPLLETFEKVADALLQCYLNKGKVLLCGNGGSAADAQHLAAELSGRFYYDRPPLFAEALHVNSSYVTAVANDYHFDNIYARLVQAMGRPGDVLIGLSTSGNSKNVVNALDAGKKIGMHTIGFTGVGGGRVKEFSDFLIDIPSSDTPRIQECHLLRLSSDSPFEVP